MKQALRIQLRGCRGSSAASAKIQQKLIAADWWPAAFQVGLYRALPGEPATDLLLADLLARDAQVAVPVRHKANYVWGWVDATTRWKKSLHGVLEPQEWVPASSDELRLVLVPGIAFDSQGGRLGHGAGHMDRLLARCSAVRVGMCFENRLLARVPMEAQDVRMDVVVTEKRWCFAPTAAPKWERWLGS